MALYDLPDDYDLDHLRAALQYVTNFKRSVDVGAHRGIWTRELLKSFEDVWAFEPVPELYAQLPKKCVAMNCAVGACFGEVAMREGDKNTGQGHVVKGSGTRMYALDVFGLEDVGFIKIDVEGYELQVLIGAEFTLKRNRPVLMIEKNGLFERYGTMEEDIDAFLENLGYKEVGQWNKDFLYVMSAPGAEPSTDPSTHRP